MMVSRVLAFLDQQSESEQLSLRAVQHPALRRTVAGGVSSALSRLDRTAMFARGHDQHDGRLRQKDPQQARLITSGTITRRPAQVRLLEFSECWCQQDISAARSVLPQARRNHKIPRKKLAQIRLLPPVGCGPATQRFDCGHQYSLVIEVAERLKSLIRRLRVCLSCARSPISILPNGLQRGKNEGDKI